MKTFNECLAKHPNNLFKASELYCHERGWTREQWYEAWQTTQLPDIVEVAIMAQNAAKARAE